MGCIKPEANLELIIAAGGSGSPLFPGAAKVLATRNSSAQEEGSSQEDTPLGYSERSLRRFKTADAFIQDAIGTTPPTKPHTN